MKPSDLLLAFGLSETEISVYLESLKHEHISASEIAQQTTLKRPTIYHALETLGEKGLIRGVGNAKVRRFKAEQPSQLQAILDRQQLEVRARQRQLEQTLPLFPSQKDVGAGVPGIEYFKGKSGIQNLIELSLKKNKKGELFTIIPTFQLTNNTFQKEYMKYYAEEKKKRQIVTKSIWGDVPTDSYFSQHKAHFRELRIIPEEQRDSYTSIILIWDSSVAIVNMLPELLGVHIKSHDYAQTMKALWQTLWSVSKSIDTKKEQ